MGQCISMLEQILVELLDAVKNAKAKEWTKLIPEAIEIAKNAWADYECFKNNASSVAKKGIDLALNGGDQKECILGHLKNAMDSVKSVPTDVIKGNWDAVSDDFEKAVDEVQAALNC